MILAIETSTDMCSLTLYANHTIYTEETIKPRNSAHIFYILLDKILDKSSINLSHIDTMLYSSGPGSYTGLRIGASALKGLFFDRKVTFIPIPTLYSFAYRAWELENKPSNCHIHAVIDAKRQHLYYSSITVHQGNIHINRPSQLRPISTFDAILKPNDIIIGNGLERISNTHKTYTINNITAHTLINIYLSNENEKIHNLELRAVDIMDYEPIYHVPEIEQPTKK